MMATKSMLLDLYTDYLISGFGQTTATGFADVLDNQVSHDMATQLLSNGYISSRRL